VNRLKAKLASKQVELEGEHHDCQISEQALCAQVVESEQRKNDALTALKEALEKSDGFKRDYEDTRVLLCFFLLSLPISFLTCIFCFRYCQLSRRATRSSRTISRP
jgi:hypothetical protein